MYGVRSVSQGILFWKSFVSPNCDNGIGLSNTTNLNVLPFSVVRLATESMIDVVFHFSSLKHAGVIVDSR